MSSDGHDIGKLKEIMLDIRSGRIAYAVLSTGGFLGIGDKLLAIRGIGNFAAVWNPSPHCSSRLFR